MFFGLRSDAPRCCPGSRPFGRFGGEGAEGLNHGISIQTQMRTDPAHHGLDEHGFRQFGLIAPFQCCQLLLAHVQLAGELVLAQARSSPRLGQLSPCFNQALALPWSSARLRSFINGSIDLVQS